MSNNIMKQFISTTLENLRTGLLAPWIISFALIEFSFAFILSIASFIIGGLAYTNKCYFAVNYIALPVWLIINGLVILIVTFFLSLLTILKGNRKDNEDKPCWNGEYKFLRLLQMVYCIIWTVYGFLGLNELGHQKCENKEQGPVSGITLASVIYLMLVSMSLCMYLLGAFKKF